MSVPRSIIDRCDAVLTQGDAEIPIITPFLPVSGLRRDSSGDLSEDSIQTIMDGIASLGIKIDTEEKRDAFIQEARYILCKINAQYEFMLELTLTSVSRSEKLDPDLLAKLQKKGQNMLDVISVSRHILEMDLEKVTEGFLGTKPREPSIKEGFQALATTISANSAALKAEKYDDIRKHGVEVSRDEVRGMDRLTELFSFANITAFGLLLYIASVN